MHLVAFHRPQQPSVGSSRHKRGRGKWQMQACSTAALQRVDGSSCRDSRDAANKLQPAAKPSTTAS